MYYEVEMADPGNKNTVCTFSVNGTQLGRLEVKSTDSTSTSHKNIENVML